MQIVVYSSKCIACGLCTDMYPTIFKMEEDCAVATNNEIPKKLESKIEDLITQCPTEAIKRK